MRQQRSSRRLRVFKDNSAASGKVTAAAIESRPEGRMTGLHFCRDCMR